MEVKKAQSKLEKDIKVEIQHSVFMVSSSVLPSLSVFLRIASLGPTVPAVKWRTSLSSNCWLSLPASLTLPELSASFEASPPVESLDVLMIEII